MSFDEAVQQKKNDALHGMKAKNFKASPEWEWFKSTVLDTLREEAVQTLRYAKDEESRLKAQMMFLAALKPEEMLDRLIQDGELANEALSTLKEDEINE